MVSGERKCSGFQGRVNLEEIGVESTSCERSCSFPFSFFLLLLFSFFSSCVRKKDGPCHNIIYYISIYYGNGVWVGIEVFCLLLILYEFMGIVYRFVCRMCAFI